MMKFFRITTPTNLDVREIVTLGLTTKVDGTKIGHKGTGLKFALAYLHRLGGFLEAKGPGYCLMSKTQDVTIRDVTHKLIELHSQVDDRVLETHMTIHAGSDTWTEPWFILRELVQNALDEGGTFEVVDDGHMPETTGTLVQITMLPELQDAWAQRDVWMQPRCPGIVFDGDPKIKGLYFHGFLVYRATQKWNFSYDCTDDVLRRSELSEDRQIRNVNLADIFRRIVAKMDFESRPEIYRMAFSLEPAEDIAAILDGIYHHINHDKKEWGGANGFKISRLTDAYYDVFGKMAAFTTDEISENDPQVYYAHAAGFTPVKVRYPVNYLLSSYTDAKPVRACLPTLQDRLKKIKSVDATRGEKLKTAMKLVRRIKPEGIRVDVVTKLVSNDTINCAALADPANNRIMVLESLLDKDIPEIAKALIEEYVHLTSGGGDLSPQMQRGLIEVIYDLLTRHRRVNVENIVT